MEVIINFLQKAFGKIFYVYNLYVLPKTIRNKIYYYLGHGRVPWSLGYNEYKWSTISNAIKNQDILRLFPNQNLPKEYGLGLDERIVEYPWILSNLKNEKTYLLDAGSTFNFEILLNNEIIAQKHITILTYFPEQQNFNEKNISYLYCDLRNTPFKNECFDEIVCQSTIEHIDMDNSLYGYSVENSSDQTEKSFEFLKAIAELIRILKKGGNLMLTFPYGKYENHGFFQQFDQNMTDQLIEILNTHGSFSQLFYKYFIDGWKIVKQHEANTSESFNPHTGKGKMNDGAAHCRSVCCIKFNKL